MKFRVTTITGRIFKRLEQLLELLLLFFCIVVPALIVYKFGFPISGAMEASISDAFHKILTIQWLLVGLIFLLNKNPKTRGAVWKLVGFIIFTVVVVLDFSLRGGFVYTDGFLKVVTSTTVVAILAMAVSVFEISRFITSLLGKRTNPAMILAGSFFIIIIIGSLLLMLPNCTVHSISYTDALFVSTSAVCVTGLTPIDIAAEFTTTGMVVLLILIQVGGLGIMTITSFFGLFFAGSRSFAGQMVVGDLIATDRLNSLLKTLVKIISVTFFIEAIGAICLYGSAIGSGNFTSSQAAFFGVFHSISAFCNAGFSTLPGNLANEKIVALSSVHYVVSFLIIFGGIGFPIFANFLNIAAHKIKNGFRRLYRIRPLVMPRLWSLNSYIVIRTTIFLVVVGWVSFLCFEWNATLAGMPIGEKLSQAFLMASTPRTAGFNGVPLQQMLPASILLTIILMWIGGAPQSTAGGIKVTTFYVAIKNIFSGSAGKESIEINRRTLPASSVQRAFAVIALSLALIAGSVMAISLLEPDVDLTRIVYEVVSAISTVGLSLDLTPHLGAGSKYILILLMFMGRVGLISIFVLFIKRKTHKPYSYPNENILIT